MVGRSYKQVFGSLHDYYYIMSDGNLDITGYILNEDIDSDNIPDWIVLDSCKSYYNELSYTVFSNEVLSKADSLGLDVDGLGTNVKLAIVYAGHCYREKSNGSSPSGLNPRANAINGEYYIMSEQFTPGEPANSEHVDRNISHIGIHAHELGHLLGLPDLYYPDNNNGWWDLMGAGNFNGPTYSGACPAPINPQLRREKGWLSFNDITSDTTLQADYNLQDPEIFRTTASTNSHNYFLIETRRFDQYMTIGSNSCPDYNNYVPHGNFTQGVVCWRKLHLNNSHGRILHIDGEEWPGGLYDDGGDFMPGESRKTVISPWSFPTNEGNWRPNTWPSTNCGWEIVYEGNGYYTIDFYSQHPEDASPSKPQGLSVENTAVASVSWGQESYVFNTSLSWQAISEPDLDYYRIYKYATTSGSEPELNQYVLIDSGSTNSANLHIVDTGDNKKVYYRITAVDTTGKESVFSESTWDWAAPSKPSNLHYSNDNNHPKIQWSGKSFPARYDLYRKIPGRWNSGYVKIRSNLNQNYYTDNFYELDYDPEHKGTVYYKVVAKRHNKSEENQSTFSLSSNFSNALSVIVEVHEEKKSANKEDIPKVFALGQNYPNPFNPTTQIKYQLPKESTVQIKLYDILGSEVAELVNEEQEAGYYELTLDGSQLSSGTYIYKITAGEFTDSKKLLLVK